MSDNTNLHRARYSKNNTDEWYTPYQEVGREVERYKDQFAGKTVYCNCDDPFNSNFCHYFLEHFNKFKLKKLICTSYSKDGKGHALEVTHVPDWHDEIQKLIRVKTKTLKGDGDFRSKECIDYLEQCDIVCTNPPFSLFRELFSLINIYEKQYLVIGTQNALTYKEIFPHIMENKARVGYKFGSMTFKLPTNAEPHNHKYYVDPSGQKYQSLGNVMWLTNLEVNDKPQLNLTKKYKEGDYPKYDNYDAIEVSKIKNIPIDYDGIMGVPITYIKYHDSSLFEIIGKAKHGSDSVYDLFKPTINGKEKFTRILIRKKEATNEQ